jgi:hypothetical protein
MKKPYLNPEILDTAPIANTKIFGKPVRDSMLWKFLRNTIIPSLSISDVKEAFFDLKEYAGCRPKGEFPLGISMTTARMVRPPKTAVKRIADMLNEEFGEDSFDSYNYEVVYAALDFICNGTTIFRNYASGSKFLLLQDLYLGPEGLHTYSIDLQDWQRSPAHVAGSFGVWNGDFIVVDGISIGVPADMIVEGNNLWLPCPPTMLQEYPVPITFICAEILVSVRQQMYDEDMGYNTSKFDITKIDDAFCIQFAKLWMYAWYAFEENHEKRDTHWIYFHPCLQTLVENTFGVEKGEMLEAPEPVLTEEEKLRKALGICVKALRNLTDNDNIYADDANGEMISFDEVEKLVGG